jgi:hypothetical protein
MLYSAVVAIYEDLEFSAGGRSFDPDALNLFPSSTSKDIVVDTI